MLSVEIAVAKVPKYAVRESGDSVEVIERPHGGLSLVMVDGQSSGRGAKIISNIAVRKAVSLLGEGVRDGAVARATHDYLRTHRGGKVSAELTMLSVDLESRTLVISRNSRCPVLLCQDGLWCSLDEPAEVVGIYNRTRPVITELPLAAGQIVVAFTDGLLHAGSRRGQGLDPLAAVQQLAPESDCSAQGLADGLLASALALDEDRPTDDTSIVALRVVEMGAVTDPQVRRMTISFPVAPI